MPCDQCITKTTSLRKEVKTIFPYKRPENSSRFEKIAKVNCEISN